MALEPINSAMTYQAEAAQRLTPVKPVAEDTDGKATQDAVNVIDATTVIVDKADAKKNESGQNEKKNPDEKANPEEKSNLEDSEKIKKYVDSLNKQMTDAECQFGIHEETKRITIKIVDKDSKKVIKEFPPEKTLDMIAKVWELAGLLVDEKR